MNDHDERQRQRLQAPVVRLEVLHAFLRLGLTSFGGPIAHLGYFRDEFVVRRKWLDEKTYADLVALCSSCPGPASSKVGIAIGLSRAGYAGALAAWAGFTLPSAIALVLFAYGVARFGDALGSGWLHGLKVVAVAVVAQAVLGMMRSLAPDRERATLAVAAAALVLAIPTAWGQIAAIVLGGVVGVTLLAPRRADRSRVAAACRSAAPPPSWRSSCSLRCCSGCRCWRLRFPTTASSLFEAFYRAGSLVFGGGHVVLPLLQASVVPPGWVSNDAFLAGYGAAQAVPGPLFTFAAYLGAVMGPGAERLDRRGALPRRRCSCRRSCWSSVRCRSGTTCGGGRGRSRRCAASMPRWSACCWLRSTIRSGPRASSVPADFALGCAAFLLLFMWQVPPWLVVVLSALGGAAIALL